MSFFNNHSVFGAYSKNTTTTTTTTTTNTPNNANTATFGVVNLVSRLTAVLVERIKNSLPSLIYRSIVSNRNAAPGKVEFDVCMCVCVYGVCRCIQLTIYYILYTMSYELYNYITIYLYNYL